MGPDSSGDEALARLLAIAADPAAYLAARAAPAVGYVCSYVPEEVILAAGLHPVRLGASPGPVGPADSCLQSFCCSFARALLDGLLTGRWKGLAGLVFAYTCDSLRAAFESWKLRAPAGTLVHFLNLPARVRGPGVTAYAATETARLASALAGLPGARPVTVESLGAAVGLVRALYDELGRLALVRSRRPDLLPGSAYLAVARAASVADRAEAVRLLAALADDLEARAGDPGPDGRRRPRVLVSGGFVETEEPLRLVEEAGADIVWDDLCLAGRRISFGSARGAVEATAAAEADLGEAFTRLAEDYLERVPCPTKHPPDDRSAWLLDQAERRGVEGVVFLLQKFCDPHAFDFPALRDRLESAGRPCLLIEIEHGTVAGGQARTRLEAFVERLASAPARRRRAAAEEAPADERG